MNVSDIFLFLDISNTPIIFQMLIYQAPGLAGASTKDTYWPSKRAGAKTLDMHWKRKWIDFRCQTYRKNPKISGLFKSEDDARLLRPSDTDWFQVGVP